MAPSGASFGVLSRCMRLSGKAATGAGTGVPTSTGRGSGCGSLLRRVFCFSLAGGPGGSLRMVHQSDRDPRPGDGGWIMCDRPSSPPFLSPRRLVMFATAWAPCLCASEARPSDRGIRCWASDPVTLVTSPTSGGRPLQRAGGLHLRECSPPAPAPPRLTSHRQVYPRAGRRLG